MTEHDRKELLEAYEAVRSMIDLPPRQRELFEAWIYSKCSMGQLALRYGINRSSVSRAVQSAAQKVAAFARRQNSKVVKRR